MELGHAFLASETNNRNYVPLCECGWIGAVVEFYRGDGADTMREQRRREITIAVAAVQHDNHLTAERERVAAEHALALDNHARYLSAVAPTVKRIGRWGAG